MRPKLEKRHYGHALALDCWEGLGLDFMAHLHPEVELCLIQEGTLTVGINGETRQLSAGWISVCGSHDIHHYRKAEKPARHILLIFRPELAGYPGIWPAGRILVSHFLTPAQANRLVPIMQELARENRQADEFQSPILRGLLAQLCGHMDRELTEAAPEVRLSSQAHGRSRMGMAIEFIRTHSHEDLRLADVAASINMSPWHFSRTFFNSSGQKFTAYLNGVRLERAEELLADANLKVLDIAMECGFGSVRSFNRAWRELRGGSPRRQLSPAPEPDEADQAQLQRADAQL